MVSTQLAAALLALTGMGETVLLDFQAEWCGPCKVMDPIVRQLAAQGYPVQKVDIDKQPNLARQYGVTSVPCFILLVDGQQRDRKVGATNLRELQQMLSRAGVSPQNGAIARGQTPRRRGFFNRSRGNAPSTPGVGPPSVSLGQPVDDISAAPSTAAPGGASTPKLVAGTPPLGAPGQRPQAPRQPALAPPVDSLTGQLLKASVRLRVEEPGGHSFGSGTIIDYQPPQSGRGGEALILTCGHIFRDSGGRGRILVETFEGARPQGHNGRLVHHDLQRDIGLVSINVDHKPTLARLAKASAKPARGDAVVSIGCDHGRAPNPARSNITAVNSFVGPPNLQVAGQPAIGRSGGGLFDQRGNLIGVCNFADPTDRAGLYASVELARAVIAQAGLSAILDNPTQLAGPASPAPDMPRTMPVTGKAAGQPAWPSRMVDAPAGVGQGKASATPTEVICVVRSGNGKDAKREVIVIDDASRELLDRLAKERQRERGAFPTSMAVPRDAVQGHAIKSHWQPQWR